MAMYYKYQKGSLVTRMMQSGMPGKVWGTNKQTNKQAYQQLPPKGNNCAMDIMAMSFVGILTKNIQGSNETKKEERKRNSSPVQG